MKIMIVNEDEKCMSGYEPVVMKDGELDLSNVSDNECTDILLNNSFTQVDIEGAAKLLVTLFSKLRMGGNVKLNGVDGRMLARNYINGDMNDQEYNDIIYSCKCTMSIPLLKTIVRKSGLKIETLELKGINYDLTATR